MGRTAVQLGRAAVVDNASKRTVEVRAGQERAIRKAWVPALALIVMAITLFVAYSSGILNAPFGDSHDGRNAGVWSAGSRSLREEGPIRSRMGTRSTEIGTYANHPPLIDIETAVAETLGAGTRIATRAPGWIGSLLLMGLLARLLLEGGLRKTAAGAAVVLAATTPMFLVYGAMLDTPVTSLPFGVGLVVLWERNRRGLRVRPLTAGAVAALAVLAGWQSLLLAGLIGLWAIVRLIRRSESPRVDAAFAGGAGAGAALLLGWFLWAFGWTLRPLVDQFRFRTGEATIHVSLPNLIASQRGDLEVMFGLVLLLGLVGLVVALRDRRTRGMALLGIAVTVPYPLMFRVGAVNHDYWNYWLLLPVAIGLAAGTDRLLEAYGFRARIVDRLVAVAAGLLAVLLTAGLWAHPILAVHVIDAGIPAGRLADHQTLPAGQRSAWYAGAVGEPASWLGVALRVPAVPVKKAELTALAAAHPDDLILVGRVSCVDGEARTTYAFQPAPQVAADPPNTEGCG